MNREVDGAGTDSDATPATDVVEEVALVTPVTPVKEVNGDALRDVLLEEGWTSLRREEADPEAVAELIRESRGVDGQSITPPPEGKTPPAWRSAEATAVEVTGLNEVLERRLAGVPMALRAVLSACR